MKRFTIITLIITVGFFLTSMPSQSRRIKNWTWKRYNIKFQLPAHWKVTKNNKYAFIAKGDGVVMKIGPSYGRTATAMSTAYKAYRSYSVLMSRRILSKRYLRKGNSGLNRYIIFGKARYALSRPAGFRGRPVQFGIIGMTNPRSAVNLYVRFYWFTDRSSASQNSRRTYRLAKSFKVLNYGY